MDLFKKLNNIVGWSIFLLASVALSTIEQTVSFGIAENILQQHIN